MLLRGQRVEVIHSNARGRMHPKVGDVGYIDNLFLFPKERFMLANVVFCQYARENKRRIERKKFILNLGMSRAIKTQISREGVNRVFFLEKDSVNLTPTFCRTYTVICRHTGDKVKTVLHWPQLVSTHGVWSSYMKPYSVTNRSNDGKFVIPCGHVSSTNRKLDMRSMDPTEIAAWLNSFGASINAMVTLYYNHYETNGTRSFRKTATNSWDRLTRVMHHQSQGDGAHLFRAKPEMIKTLSRSALGVLSSTINKLYALNYVALQRTESYSFHRIDDKTKASANSKVERLSDWSKPLSVEWCRRNNVRSWYARLIPAILYRTAFTGANVETNIRMLGELAFGDPDYFADKAIKDIQRIHTEARSDSAALARIFDVLDSPRAGGVPAGYMTTDFLSSDKKVFLWQINTGRIRSSDERINGWNRREIAPKSQPSRESGRYKEETMEETMAVSTGFASGGGGSGGSGGGGVVSVYGNDALVEEEVERREVKFDEGVALDAEPAWSEPEEAVPEDVPDTLADRAKRVYSRERKLMYKDNF